MKQTYINGNIYTMNGKEKASAMIIDDGIITSIGSNEDILSMLNKNSDIIDLDNHTIIPGINDCHLHVLQTAKQYEYIDLNNTFSIDDIIRIGKENLSKDQNKWLLGKGWNQNNFKNPTIFTKDDLDKISKDIPIAFTRICIHVTIVNSKALELINEVADIYNPDSTLLKGHLDDIKNGVLKEKDQDILGQFIAPNTNDEIKDLLIKMNPIFAQYGITSVQSDDFSAFTNIDFETIIDVYKDLNANNLLTYKVYQQCALPNIEILSEFIGKGYKSLQDYQNYRLGPLKLYLDGSLGAWSALINDGYKDAHTFGQSNYSDSALTEICTYAQEEDMQIAIHGIGDKAVERILLAYSHLQEENINNIHRHGIIHAQITTPRLVDNISRSKTCIYAQPIFVATDRHIVEQRVGKDKAATSYAFKQMIEHGVKVGFSTDAPVESINPFENIYSAVTRKDPFHPSDKPFQDYDTIDIWDAIEAYTTTPAYLSFEEDKKGSLEKGKVADFIVLDQDIFEIDSESIKDIQVLRTVIDGNLIYSK
ncbi:amidohydrolase [Mycoplasma sp. P36-A1]|uniref:amidohydrolase n=1 Tax=Mycoplasma sp. P36-A1 TaxID=3252900 RepID=UPI003C2C636C